MTGDPVVGATLRVSTGDWLFDPSGFEFRWQSCDADGKGCIARGADSADYVVESADLGRTIRATIVASNAAGKAKATSAAVGPVGPATPAASTDDVSDGDVDGGLAGQPLSAQLTAPGLERATWNLASGQLPIGLSLSSSGLLSGTPGEEGDFSVVLRATSDEVAPFLQGALAALVGGTVSACDPVGQPTYAVECDVVVVVYPGVNLTADAVRLPAASYRGIDSWDPDTGVIGFAPGVDLDALEVGSVFDVPADNTTVPLGGLRRAVSSSPRSDGGTEWVTAQAELPEYILSGAIRQEATDKVDDSGEPVGSPSPRCGRGNLEEISLMSVSLPGGVTVELSGSACIVESQRIEVSDGDTTRYKMVHGLRDVAIEGTISGPSADLDVKLLDLVKFDDLFTGVPGMPVRPNVDVGLFASIRIANPFEVGFKLSQDWLYETICDGLTCSEPELIEDESELETVPEDLGTFADGDVVEYSVSLSAGIDLGIEVIKPGVLNGGKPTVLARFMTASWRAGFAIRGAANPAPSASDHYPFDWAVYVESMVQAELFSLDLDTFLGRFRIAGPTYTKTFQLPLARSHGLSFTNFPDSAHFPFVAQAGSKLPKTAVNVVQVDGQITPATGQLHHPSEMGDIPIELELRSAAEDEDGDLVPGDVVPGALTGTTTEITDADGIVNFDDVEVDESVEPGSYVLAARAEDPDEGVFAFERDGLRGVSPVITVEHMDWLPTAVHHLNSIQLGWSAYEPSEAEGGEVAGYRIYRVDADDDAGDDAGDDATSLDGVLPYAFVPASATEGPYCTGQSDPVADEYGGCVTWTDPDAGAVDQRYAYLVAPCIRFETTTPISACLDFAAGEGGVGVSEVPPVAVPRAPSAPSVVMVDYGSGILLPRLVLPDLPPDHSIQIFGCSPVDLCGSTNVASFSWAPFELVSASNMDSRVPTTIQRNFEWGRYGPPHGVGLTGELCPQIVGPCGGDFIEHNTILGPGPIEVTDYCGMESGVLSCSHWPNRWVLLTLSPEMRESVGVLLTIQSEIRISVVNSLGQASPLSQPVFTPDGL